ncbi:MAG: hypothetical protein DMF72_21675 [Acidobacteria bacterium]|nr:MAG: hypothetical protein DMF72_21675 [Acidobacteriota bacterium]
MCAPESDAASRTAAVLRIEVTVVPTVQSTPAAPLHPAPSGAIVYSLQPASTQSTTQKTLQQMPTPKLQELPNTVSIVNDGKSCVLETLTVIGE